MLCTILLSAAAALFYYFALSFDFDQKLNHFERGSIFFVLSVVLICAALAVSVVIALFSKRMEVQVKLPGGSGLTFFAIMTGLLLIASAVFSLIDISSNGGAGKFDIVRHLLAIPAAVYFLAVALTKTQEDGSTKPSGIACALLGIFPVAWSIFSMMAAYFDGSVELNSPLKTVPLCFYIVTMLYFAAEGRHLAGNGIAPKFVLFVSAGAAVTLFTSFPQLAISLFDDAGFGYTMLESGALFAMALYMTARAFTSLSVKSDD